MSSAPANLRLEHQDRIWILTIDRADKRNALTPDMITGMTRLARSVREGALVVAGAGPVFCSGFDLTLCKDAPDGSVMRSLLTSLSELVSVLRSLESAVVIAAQGGALAGGCAILGGGDLIVTDTGAKLGYPVVKIGVSPAVSAPFLTGLTNPGPARSRLLDPGLITGADALRMGLAHYCTPTPQEVLPRAIELARGLAEKPPAALGATKSWLQHLDEPAAAAAAGLNASLELTGSPEEQELLARALFAIPRRTE